MIIDVLLACLANNQYIMACEETIMMWDLIIDFMQNIWGCDYYIINLFCRKLCQYIILRIGTCLIEAIVVL